MITGLMLFSFALPWWSVIIYTPSYEGLPTRPASVQIYGYGLKHDMQELQQYILEDETPPLLHALAWVYISTAIVTPLCILWIRKLHKLSWLAGLTGVSYILYTLIAVYVVVKNRAHEFGAELTGLSGATYYNGAEVSIGFEASIHQGFFLALFAGLALLMVSLFNLFILKKQLYRKYVQHDI